MEFMTVFNSVVLVALIVLPFWAYAGEKKLWNRGFCEECLGIWECFDCDSGGARGYKCLCKYRHIWISYPGID